MKKLLVTLLIFIIAIFIIAPFFIGVAAEKQIDKQVKTLTQKNSIDISNVYKKGWFASSAETTFDLSKILNQYTKLNTNIITGFKNIIVKTRSEIYHGPFPLKRLYSKQPIVKPVLSVTKNITKIILPPDVTDFTPAITSYISVFPDGSGKGVFSVSELNYNNIDEQSRLKLSEISGKIAFSSDMSKRYFSVHIPKLFIKEKQTMINIDNLDFSFNKDKSTEFKSFAQNLNFGKTEFNNCALSASNKENNGLMAFDLNINIEKVKDATTEAGPVEFYISGKNIYKEAYDKIADLYLEMNNHKTGKQDEKLANVFIMTQIMSLIPEILAKSPKITLKNKICTQDGDILLNGDFKVDNSSINNINNLKQIIKSIVFEFSVSMPESAAQKYIFNSNDSQASATQKMMIKSGNKYKLNILYKNANLTVNGKPFSFVK